MALAPRLLAVAGAVLMPVSLFLDWYAVKAGAAGDNARIELEGWDAFESTDAVMVLASLATLALVLTAPRMAARALMLVGALVTGFVLVQLIDRPAVLLFVDRSDISLEIGAWLGLGGALAILAAGFLLRGAGAGHRPAPGSDTAP